MTALHTLENGPTLSADVQSEHAIELSGITKVYPVYRAPEDRLKQMLSSFFFRSKKKIYYNQFFALSDVNFNVKKGETLGIIGRNGSGKSTLLQIIAGTLSPTAGSLTVKGKIAALLELGAGFNPEFTGRENINLAATLLGLSEAALAERFPAIVTFAGIGDFIDQPVKHYSSGMFARLAFAVAAHVDAELLIVDETLSVGDAAFTQKCMRFLDSFRAKGTLLFVSHDTSSVLRLCDRAAWLDRGRLRALGPAKEVCHEYHASLYSEGDQSDRFTIGGKVAAKAPPPVVERDFRAEQLAQANPVQIFDFNTEAPWFGTQGENGAKVLSVTLHTPAGEQLHSIYGGEEVVLTVECTTATPIANPIVGFYLRDRLGQQLFGDNTYLSSSPHFGTVHAGEKFKALFRFTMPYLSTGDYSFTVGVATGTQNASELHQWVNDALFIRSLSSHIQRGIIGIPMREISLIREGV